VLQQMLSTLTVIGVGSVESSWEYRKTSGAFVFHQMTGTKMAFDLEPKLYNRRVLLLQPMSLASMCAVSHTDWIFELSGTDSG
jgi:hypothetical protein